MMLTVLGSGCAAQANPTDNPAPPYDPARRAATIETTGCGFAPDRTGSGVAVGDGLVLTVAHLVARADAIVASVADNVAVDAVVTAIDLERDLAILRVPANSVPPVETATFRAPVGSDGLIVGGAASGTVPFEVADVVRISIEEILGTDRHRRLGFELAAVTATGDSGAGAYNDLDQLIGIVFATSDGGTTTWITSSAEIDRFLAAHGSTDAAMQCDAAASQLDL